MGAYVVRRLILFVPTIFLVTLLVFLLMRVLPGDPALLALAGPEGEGSFSQEDLESLRQKLGTDRPVHVQYVTWMLDLLQGDLGESFYYRGVPVIDELKSRVPVTVELAILAIALSFLVSIPLGVLSALYLDRWPDYLIKIFTIGGVSLPTFWVGIIIIFSLVWVFDWLPQIGYVPLWEDPLTNLKQFMFPALALGYHNSAYAARVTRSSMLEVLGEDYIRTARSKGLTESVVVFRHALKNAFLPVITITGASFAGLLGGTVIIEIIFTLPGLGNLLIDSILRQDYMIVQAVILTTALVVVVLNLLVDLTYGWLNPRIRYG